MGRKTVFRSPRSLNHRATLRYPKSFALISACRKRTVGPEGPRLPIGRALSVCRSRRTRSGLACPTQSNLSEVACQPPRALDRSLPARGRNMRKGRIEVHVWSSMIRSRNCSRFMIPHIVPSMARANVLFKGACCQAWSRPFPRRIFRFEVGHFIQSTLSHALLRRLWQIEFR